MHHVLVAGILGRLFVYCMHVYVGGFALPCDKMAVSEIVFKTT